MKPMDTIYLAFAIAAIIFVSISLITSFGYVISKLNKKSKKVNKLGRVFVCNEERKRRLALTVHNYNVGYSLRKAQ